MANHKKTNIKIKKSKYNLYNKKKSKSRQALAMVLTIVAACVLGVVGYGIGKPIMNYLQSRKDPPISDSTPVSDVSEPSDESSTASSDSTSSSVTSEPSPIIISKNLKLCVLSPETVTSTASLNSALAVARESGYDTVAVTLKDERGFLYYSSDIESVRGTGLVVGTLSAAQICDYITKAGMTPAVKINTLKDSGTPAWFGGYTLESGIKWVDDRPEAGGKFWLSPFEDQTVKYIGELTSELSEAGFRHIICANTTYPAFHVVDGTEYLTHLPITEKTPRLEALWKVADAAKAGAEAGGAQLWLEFTGSAFAAADKYATDAELASDKSKLEGFGIIADYTMNNVEEAYSDALKFAEKIRAQASADDLAVLIKDGPSGAALDDIKRAFDESGIRAFDEN